MNVDHCRASALPHAHPPRPKQRNLHSGTRRYFANCGRAARQPLVTEAPPCVETPTHPPISGMEAALNRFLWENAANPLRQMVAGTICAVLPERSRAFRGRMRAILEAMGRNPSYGAEAALHAVLDDAGVPAQKIGRTLREAARHCAAKGPNGALWTAVKIGGGKRVTVEDALLAILFAQEVHDE